MQPRPLPPRSGSERKGCIRPDGRLLWMSLCVCFPGSGSPGCPPHSPAPKATTLVIHILRFAGGKTLLMRKLRLSHRDPASSAPGVGGKCCQLPSRAREFSPVCTSAPEEPTACPCSPHLPRELS